MLLEGQRNRALLCDLKDFLVMKSSKIVLDPTPCTWVGEGSKGFCIDFRVAVTETLGTEIKRLGEGHGSDCRMEDSGLLRYGGDGTARLEDIGEMSAVTSWDGR